MTVRQRHGVVIYDESGHRAFVNTSGRVLVDAAGVSVSVSVSGQLVAVSGSIATSVSGNVVVVPSTSVSGNVVYLVSGQNAVQISGETVLTSVSGQSIQIVEGGNVVDVNTNYNFTESTTENSLFTVAGCYGMSTLSGTLLPMMVTMSGEGMSGVFHRLAVAFSGDYVKLTSGDTVRTYIADGEAGSNLAYVNAAIDTIGTGDPSLYGIDHLYGYNKEFNNWPSLSVTASGHAISGLVHKLVVGFSGDPVSISGNAVSVSGNAVGISGQSVVITSGKVMIGASGTNELAGVYWGNDDDETAQTLGLQVNSRLLGYERASGVWVRLNVTQSGRGVSGIPYKLVVAFSGDPVTVSGNVVNTSGNVNYDFGTLIRTTSGTIVTSLSGGTELGSGIVINATVRNLSGNGPMYVGGTGPDAPFSGKGMILFGNESQTYDIDNFNKIRLFANTSGQRVRVIGVAAV